MVMEEGQVTCSIGETNIPTAEEHQTKMHGKGPSGTLGARRWREEWLALENTELEWKKLS